MGHGGPSVGGDSLERPNKHTNKSIGLIGSGGGWHGQWGGWGESIRKSSGLGGNGGW